MTDTKPRNHKWLPLLAVSLGSFMLLVDVTIVNVALPDMALDFGASFTSLQWVFDIYAIALAALLLGAGALADRHGHRTVYLGGLLLFALSSLCSGLAPGTTALIVARGFQGIGAAAMFSTTIALINDSYSGRERGIAFGVWGAVNGAASAAGPILGGLLTQGLSWRWAFFVNLPVSAAAVALTLAVLPRTTGSGSRRIDVPGIAAFTLFAASLTYAMTRAAAAGWSSASTLALFGLAALAALAFVVIQLRVAEPIVDLGLLRRPAFAGTLIAALLLSVAAFGISPYLSLWLQSVRGMSPIGAGLAFVPLSLAVLVTALGLGRVLHRVSPRLPISIGLALVGAGALLQAHLGAGSGWTAIAPGLAVVGAGVGLVSPTLASAALASVPAERSGMAAGAVNTMRQLGFALGIAALGAITQAGIAAKLGTEGAARSGELAEQVVGGQTRSVLAAAGNGRDALDAAIHASFASGLDVALVVAGAIGLLGGVLTAVMLRPSRSAALSARRHGRRNEAGRGEGDRVAVGAGRGRRVGELGAGDGAAGGGDGQRRTAERPAAGGDGDGFRQTDVRDEVAVGVGDRGLRFDRPRVAEHRHRAGEEARGADDAGAGDEFADRDLRRGPSRYGQGEGRRGRDRAVAGGDRGRA
jgi:EmrB/QacA subfamily drug resistance transporter